MARNFLTSCPICLCWTKHSSGYHVAVINANATVIPCRAQTETSRNYLHGCDVCLCQ